jgi:hypothetical protein
VVSFEIVILILLLTIFSTAAPAAQQQIDAEHFRQKDYRSLLTEGNPESLSAEQMAMRVVAAAKIGDKAASLRWMENLDRRYAGNADLDGALRILRDPDFDEMRLNDDYVKRMKKLEQSFTVRRAELKTRPEGHWYDFVLDVIHDLLAR